MKGRSEGREKGIEREGGLTKRIEGKEKGIEREGVRTKRIAGLKERFKGGKENGIERKEGRAGLKDGGKN